MTIRRPLIAGNWKMHKTIQEARNFALGLQEKVHDVTEMDMVICAPFTNLYALKEELEESIIHIGAQICILSPKERIQGKFPRLC